MNDNGDRSICPLRYITDILGGKWKMPIICILADQKPKRYSTIKRRLRDITNMMLAHSLRELEADGMVTRVQYNEIPPRVEYSLTERGVSAVPVLTAAAEWAVHELGDRARCEECRSSL